MDFHSPEVPHLCLRFYLLRRLFKSGKLLGLGGFTAQIGTLLLLCLSLTFLLFGKVHLFHVEFFSSRSISFILSILNHFVAAHTIKESHTNR
nr:hypothetical protein Q903MT_gene5037 [Picea sitchensis]